MKREDVKREDVKREDVKREDVRSGDDYLTFHVSPFTFHLSSILRRYGLRSFIFRKCVELFGQLGQFVAQVYNIPVGGDI